LNHWRNIKKDIFTFFCVVPCRRLFPKENTLREKDTPFSQQEFEYKEFYNTPNPFSEYTTFSFTMRQPRTAQIFILNLKKKYGHQKLSNIVSKEIIYTRLKQIK